MFTKDLVEILFKFHSLLGLDAGVEKQLEHRKLLFIFRYLLQLDDSFIKSVNEPGKRIKLFGAIQNLLSF